MMSLLQIRNLKTYFFTYRGVVRAVDGVDLEIDRGDTLGLVGETGCGKSVTALSIMRLVPPPGKIIEGEIIFNNEDLLKKTDYEMRKIRGKSISMIFQDPTTSLNPVFDIRDQLSEVLRLHQSLSKTDSYKRSFEMLQSVAFPDAKRRIKSYPHQLSGGMRQRVMIAMALACNPDLLIADEPTTSLDVTIQAQILDLMKSLKQKVESSILLITHNLGLVAEMCNKVAIMYAGDVVEKADVLTLFEKPRHPYTYGLLRCIPGYANIKPKGKLAMIPGLVPDAINIPTGCKFSPRCPYVDDKCLREKPELFERKPRHFVACFKPI